MTDADGRAIATMIAMAREHSDGHFTVMRFTTNWRVCLHSPPAPSRRKLADMAVGDTLEQAVAELANRVKGGLTR